MIRRIEKSIRHGRDFLCVAVSGISGLIIF